MIGIRPLPAVRRAAWQRDAVRRLLDRRLHAGVHEQVARESVDGLVARAEEQVSEAWEIVEEGHPLGTAWTVRRSPGGAHLVDLDVPVARAAETAEALASRLRAESAEYLVVDAFNGDEVGEAVRVWADAPLEATQMQLDLRGPVHATTDPGARATLDLAPMSDPEYAEYEVHLLTAYAQEMLDAGAYADWDAALAASARSQDELLPEGLRTPGHHLWTARHGDRRIGILWIVVSSAAAFIYDLEVDEEHRGRGYGRATLDAGALAARRLGAQVLGLNVFGPNERARALYERAGYATTERTYRLRFRRP